MNDNFLWVIDTRTLRLILERAAAGDDVNDLILDLWESRNPETTHVKLLGGDAA